MTWNMLYNALMFPVELILAESMLLHHSEKKPQFALRAALFLSVYAGMAVAFDGRNAAGLMPGNGHAGLFLRYILLWLMTAAGIWFCFQGTLYQVFLTVLCGYALQHAAYSIQIVSRIFLGTLLHIPLRHGFAGRMASDIIVFGGVYLISYLLLLRRFQYVKSSVNIGNILVLSAGTLINVLFLNTSTLHFSTYQNILYRILSVFNCLLVPTVLIKIMENARLKKDVEMMEQLSRMKGEYYEALRENILRTNIKCHDFKHQIHQLRNGQGGTQTDGSALDEMERAIDDYDAMAKTGNEDLDLVLTEKNLLCARKRIRLKFMVDGKCLAFMRTQDVYTLFGNLLDNAIEAAERIPEDGRRVVSLTVWQKGEIVSVRLSNFYVGEIRMRGGLPETTKEDAYNHGYGVRSMQYIVGRYQGEMVMTAEDSVFETVIVFPAGSRTVREQNR